MRVHAHAHAASIHRLPVATPAKGADAFDATKPPVKTPPDTSRIAAPDNRTRVEPSPRSSEALLEQLQADWGRTDSPMDLTRDGRVDTSDLLHLLNNWNDAAPVVREATPDDQGAIHGRPAIADDPHGALEELQRDWGRTDSSYDLTDDGTVDTDDVLRLLNGWPAPPTNEPPADPQIALDQLQREWGRDDSAYDLNADRTVDADDVLNLLNRWPSAPTPNTPLDTGTLIDALQRDWGESNSIQDRTGDNVVDVEDLLRLLNGERD